MVISTTSRVLFLLFFFLMVNFSCYASSSMEARKLLRVHEEIPSENKKMQTETAAAEYESLYLNVLPKGKVPASTPSNKGHHHNPQIIDDQKLLMIPSNRRSRHLVAVDRILRSVPSPGVGH